jgi:5'-3' exonuclease
MIVVPEFMVETPEEFIGFISGIISQDRDLQQVYLDSFLSISGLEDKDITETVSKLDKLSEKFGIDFILSVSKDEDELPESVRSKIVISL